MDIRNIHVYMQSDRDGSFLDTTLDSIYKMVAYWGHELREYNDGTIVIYSGNGIFGEREFDGIWWEEEPSLSEPETSDDLFPVDYDGNFAPQLINQHVYAESEFFDSLTGEQGNLPSDNAWDETSPLEY